MKKFTKPHLQKKLEMEKKIKKIFSQKNYSNHSLPKSRRDFIKFGLIAGGGYVLSPFLKPLNAFAAQDALMPFMVLDLAGGAALTSNFLVGGPGGPTDLVDYKRMGWNPKASGALDYTFGLPMSANESRILRGLKEVLPSELQSEGQKYIKMASVCNFSEDDTSSNASSLLHMVNKIGFQGSIFKRGLGLRATTSGGNSSTFNQDSAYTPKAISRLEDIYKLTSLGAGFDNLSKKDKELFFNLSLQSSKSLRGAYTELQKFGFDHTKGNPFNNRAVSEIYDENNEQEVLEASISYNVLNNYTGPGCITIDGCDYHNGKERQQESEDKDLEIGRSLGKLLTMAHTLRKPLFIQMITDGGIYADPSNNYERIWQGDERLHSLTVMVVYDPDQRISFVETNAGKKMQLGNYDPTGRLDLNTRWGSEGGGVAAMARSVLINYLSLQNKLSLVEKYLNIRSTSNEIDESVCLVK